MCCKRQILGIALTALGAGLLISCLLDSLLLRFLFGAALIVVGLLIGNR